MFTSRCSLPEYGTTMLSSPCSLGVISSRASGPSASDASGLAASAPGSCPVGAAASPPCTTARTGCPPVPFFLRQSSCSQPSRLVASQPSPTAAPMVSLVPPLKEAGATPSAFGASGVAAVASVLGASTVVLIASAETAGGACPVLSFADPPAGCDLLHATTPPTTNQT